MFCWSRLESTGGPISSLAVYDASFCHLFFFLVVFVAFSFKCMSSVPD